MIKAFQKATPNVKSTPRAIQYVDEWIKLNARGRKVITITLREFSRVPDRNSSLKDWGDFAGSLDTNIYFPVILRDTDKDFQSIPKELESVTLFHQPVWNIELRSALYELSYLNLLKDNGIGVFCYLNHSVKYLYFHSMTDSLIEYWHSAGISYGESFAWSNEFQKIVWEKDDLINIKQEFEIYSSFTCLACCTPVSNNTSPTASKI